MALEDSDPSVPPRPLPETTKSDNGKQVIGSDDLVPRERKRLGDYASFITQKNTYNIKPDSELVSLRTRSGNPAPISDIDTNANKTYMDDVASTTNGRQARNRFEDTSNSGQLDTDTKFEIKKGKSDDDKRTGNDYFRDIDQNLGRSEVAQRIEKNMVDNNRFSEGTPAYISGQPEGVGNTLGSLIVQPALGQHVPERFPKKASGEGSGYVAIGIDKLKNFGLTTLLNASGELNVPKDLSDPYQALGANQTANAPGLARIGQRVPVSRFDGVKILNDLEPTFHKEIRNKQPQGPDILSYGNANSPLVPFAGLLSASSISSAQILALTVSGMVRALYETLNAINEERQLLTGAGLAVNNAPSANRKLRLGSHEGKTDQGSIYRPYRDASVINLVKTKYPYFKCVDKGISIFFGTTDTAQLAIVNNNNIQLSSGWYNTVFRSLIRTTGDLLTSVLATSTAIRRQGIDVDPNLGGTGSVAVDVGTAAVTYISAINNSPILKFMNILALMGEAHFMGVAADGMTVDTINDLGEDPDGNTFPKLGVIHAKSRLSDQFGNKMAWANNTVKSMYLLPNEIKTAALRLDGDEGRFSAFTPERGFKPSDTGRLSSEDVERMEDYLEADYMPFYFHDLRTNEIVSFHAFLDSIADNYTVDYTESEAYGRVGKVLTYKNTDRTIELKFAIVSTGPDDFDDMWFKINKLTTLLHPQYTQGRSVQFGNDAFIQPFSQVPAASPLIRLRLGDIFKSNYNKFDLARIFGLASPEFQLETPSQVRAREQSAALEAARIQIRNRMNAGDWRAGDVATLVPNYTPVAVEGEGYQRVVEEGASTPVPVEGASLPLGDLFVTSPIQATVVDPNARYRNSAGGNAIKIRINNPSDASQEGEFVVSLLGSPIPLIVYEPEIERQAQLQVGSGDTTTDQEADTAAEERQRLDTFFTPTGDTPNPIFKSFESVRGRGLAGFIKSMNFEIDENSTWETSGLNNRAPKMVRVSMQFLPIYDIQPGLDHNGYNNAPIYNVGSLMKHSTRKSQADLAAKENSYRQNTQITRGRNRR